MTTIFCPGGRYDMKGANSCVAGSSTDCSGFSGEQGRQFRTETDRRVRRARILLLFVGGSSFKCLFSRLGVMLVQITSASSILA